MRRKKYYYKKKDNVLKRVIIVVGIYSFAILALISACLCVYYRDLKTIEREMREYHQQDNNIVITETETITEATTNAVTEMTTEVTTTNGIELLTFDPNNVIELNYVNNVETVSETTTERVITYVPGRYADLGNRGDITVEDMNKVLQYWYNRNSTPFYGHSQDFIDAANASGLDPIYILSHAAQESGWGRHHLGKNNYFGINATDGNELQNGYVMGDSMRAGLINGAVWISENYYKKGENTLYLMIYGGRCYATARDAWIRNIESIMTSSYNVLKA